MTPGLECVDRRPIVCKMGRKDSQGVRIALLEEITMIGKGRDRRRRSTLGPVREGFGSGDLWVGAANDRHSLDREESFGMAPGGLSATDDPDSELLIASTHSTPLATRETLT